MIRPQAALLAGGTWYVAEDRAGAAPLLGCGGWTVAAPGGAATPRLGHLRHFATRPNATRRGIGTRILARCVADASATGVEALECLATLAAEPFYARLGFARLDPTRVMLADAVAFPAVRMRLRLGRLDRG